MKTSIVILAAALAFGSTAGAIAKDNTSEYFSHIRSYSVEKVDKAAKNYLVTLDMENEGVVESGLAQVAALKLALPATAFTPLKDKVADLAASGRTPTIRYKAYVTLMVFDNPAMFNEECCSNYSDGDQLFVALSKRIQETLFVGSL